MEKKLWKRWEGSEERMEKRAGGETVGKDEGEHQNEKPLAEE